MANRLYRRGGRDDYERGRNDGYPRQAEQFEEAGWRQREDERHSGQLDEPWDRDEPYSTAYTGDQDRAWRQGRGETRSADYHPGRETGYSSGGYGRARYRGSGARGFASFTGSDQGGRDFSGPRYNYGPGRNPATPYGAYGAGSYGEGVYGAAPRHEFGGHAEGERDWFDRAGDEVASWFGDEEAARCREQDHRGKGPAGYARSDERIREDVNDCLTEDWRVDASKVEVTVNGGEVTLDGTVSTREQKRRAEDLVEDLSGVRHVQNNLRIQQSTTWDRNNSRETDLD